MVTLEDDVDGGAGWQLEVQLEVLVDVDEGELEATAAEEYACPPCEDDYACPICIELLLRPVTLSCVLGRGRTYGDCLSRLPTICVRRPSVVHVQTKH